MIDYTYFAYGLGLVMIAWVCGMVLSTTLSIFRKMC